MIGYYPYLESGELLYSATARAVALLFPGKDTCAATRLLGDSKKSFGGLLPQHCRLLQQNVPALRDLTREQIVDGSLYHLVTPFFTPTEISNLRDSMFNAARPRHIQFFQRGELRYCPVCARDDHKQDRPFHWRVLQNHPSVTCCELHRVVLRASGARFECFSIHDPAKWIRLDDTEPEPAAPIEITVATDARWLHEQKSALLPGRQRIEALLIELLAISPEFADHPRELSSNKLSKVVRDYVGPAFPRLESGLSRLACFTLLRERDRLLRYSVLAQLAGKSLRDVVEAAVRNDPAPDHKERVIEFMKRRMIKAVEGNPTASRWDLRSSPVRHVVSRLSKVVPEFYQRTAPPKRFATPEIWQQRDRAYHGTIVALRPLLTIEEGSIEKRIMKKAGIPWSHYSHNHARLPLTHVILDEIKKDCVRGRCLQSAIHRILAIVNERPDATRKEVAAQCGRPCQFLKKVAPEIYVAIMPPSAIPAFHGPHYWRARDECCSGLVAKAEPPGGGWLEESHVLAGSDLPSSLLRQSGDLLPKTKELVATLLKASNSSTATSNCERRQSVLDSRNETNADGDAYPRSDAGRDLNFGVTAIPSEEW